MNYRHFAYSGIWTHGISMLGRDCLNDLGLEGYRPVAAVWTATSISVIGAKR